MNPKSETHRPKKGSANEMLGQSAKTRLDTVPSFSISKVAVVLAINKHAKKSTIRVFSSMTRGVR